MTQNKFSFRFCLKFCFKAFCVSSNLPLPHEPNHHHESHDANDVEGNDALDIGQQVVERLVLVLCRRAWFAGQPKEFQVCTIFLDDPVGVVGKILRRAVDHLEVLQVGAGTGNNINDCVVDKVYRVVYRYFPHVRVVAQEVQPVRARILRVAVLEAYRHERVRAFHVP